MAAYDATLDTLFRGWPMAALIDDETASTGEWLAASLQNNRRAVLVGGLTASGSLIKRSAPSRCHDLPGPSDFRSTVPLGAGLGALILVTGQLDHNVQKGVKPDVPGAPRR